MYDTLLDWKTKHDAKRKRKRRKRNRKGKGKGKVEAKNDDSVDLSQ